MVEKRWFSGFENQANHWKPSRVRAGWFRARGTRRLWLDIAAVPRFSTTPSPSGGGATRPRHGAESHQGRAG